MSNFPQDQSPSLRMSLPLRPAWVTKVNRQTAIVIRDASSSMSGSKASEASSASLGLVTALAAKANKGAFDVAVIDFSSNASLVVPPRQAESVAVPNITPDGGTDIQAALILAESVLRTIAPEQARPVMLLFSDGQCNGADPVPLATQLKAVCDIVSVAFGDDADDDLLMRIATSDEHFYRVQDDGASLRRLFVAVGNSLSASLRANVNASIALGQLG